MTGFYMKCNTGLKLLRPKICTDVSNFQNNNLATEIVCNLKRCNMSCVHDF